MSSKQCVTRKGKAWFLPSGKRMKRDERARKLAIPPAYTNVCVRTDPSAKLQATAVDKKGKTHYYYHPDHVRKSQSKRLKRVRSINGKRILDATARVIDRGERDKAWRAAVALRLIAMTGIRSGSPKYLAENGSVGAMTLQPKHVVLGGGGGVSLRFKGKSNVEHDVAIKDARLGRAMRWLKANAGDRKALFGVQRDDLNALLRVHGKDLQLKDLRTMLAMNLYRAYHKKLKAKYPDETEKKRSKDAVRLTAKQLGHSPAVCRKYYLLDL